MNEFTEKEQALDFTQSIKLSPEAEGQMQENVRKLEDELISQVDARAVFGDEYVDSIFAKIEEMENPTSGEH